MADFDARVGRGVALYSACIAIVYIILGFLEVFYPFGLIPRDFFGGAVLLLIGITYFAGVKGTFEGEYNGLSFVIGGMFLSVVFGALYMAIFFADVLSWLIESADTPPTIISLRPEVYMLGLILPLMVIVNRMVRGIKL